MALYIQKTIRILIAFVFISFLCTNCQYREPASYYEKDSISDPIETYALMKSDSLHGITIVSLTDENPLKVRENILKYEIPETSFEAKRSKFYELLNALDLLTSFSEPNIYNIVDSMNYLAAYYLQHILEDPKSLTSPIKHRMLTVTSSTDKNLRVYAWDENAGMSFKTHINVFQYRSIDGKLNACLNETIESDTDFNLVHAKIKALYKLPVTHRNPLYLVHFSGFNCRECLFEGISSIEIINDSLSFDYHIFNDSLPYLIFNYTPDDKFKLSYNHKRHILSYTWIKHYDNLRDTIREHFIFSNNFFFKQGDY
ncbi:MAG: hypothetical protein WC142_00870 [Bacteroidales bacterium]|jgi:hypothetical protein|nr:hypothetical protein [Bacteroidales bacterium]MDD2687713.1 hypothetical protein [Bacteroidales bacterium]MDD3330034.1 hypothetical protein [Bacteroidales bacterium]MDD3690840.1 hypothetical protein [Bacteroidales bacterium]MDD4044128.1 hypothetical protein [Bacteroidales bacterium]